MSIKENSIFWDKKISRKELKQILKDENHSRFVELVASILSRTNDPSLFFRQYLDKITFCRNWQKLKRKMRGNKWSDNRIVFWDEVYRVLIKRVDKKALKRYKKKHTVISKEIKELGKKIRTARIARELTQKDLASKANVSQQLVSFLENGYLNVSYLTLKKVTDALGLTISIT